MHITGLVNICEVNIAQMMLHVLTMRFAAYRMRIP